jgi:hypothetical protein
MKQNSFPSLDHFLHPFVFVLKEGLAIQDDCFDYSLLLLNIGQGDILRSPASYRVSSTQNIQLLKK